jgi:hypothetical protein
MHEVRAAAVVFLCACLLACVAAYAYEPPARSADFTIRLKSRAILPAEGIPPCLPDRMETGGRAHVMIQFRRVPGPALVRSLEHEGVALLDYISGMAYSASVSGAGLDHLAGLGAVRAVVPFQAADKMSRALRRGLVSAESRNDDGSFNLAVVFFEDTAPGVMTAVAGKYGRVREVAPRERVLVVSTARELIGAMAREDEVEWVEEAALPRALVLDRVRATVGADIVQAPPYDLDGAGSSLGMWEANGPAETHVDFTGRLILADGAAPGDHATLVGGIMAGDGSGSENRGGTPYQWRGIATAAEIVSYTWAGSVPVLIAETAEAIATYGIILSNNSWGWYLCGYMCSLYGDYDAWSKQYDRTVRGVQGAPISIVFGAGNDRECFECEDSLAHFPYGTVSPPGATAKNTIGVGAVNALSKTMTTFSGWGPTQDGRLKPDIVAPGCNDTTGVTGPVPPNDYNGDLCGTSFSTPVVSGSIGILNQQFGLLGRTEVKPHTFKAVLIQTAEDLGNPGPDYAYGHGMLDLKRAVDLVIADYPAHELIRPDSVGDSLMNACYMDVPAGAAFLRVTLVWDDKQAAPAAERALVNDLDLILRDPAGAPHYAYVLDPDNPSAPATRGINTVDNVEVVEVAEPAPGRWSAEVHGALVPEGPQPYTLVLPYEYSTGGIEGSGDERPGYELHPARPNPFGSSTLITFDLGERAAVRLRVYDARGRMVRSLCEGEKQAGRHTAAWDGADQAGEPAAPGIYFCRLETAAFAATERIVLIR